jgi:N-acetylglucosaminyldiphosphoundecaprenol N-acetyl-beta-D-mannosaminyltransferase
MPASPAPKRRLRVGRVQVDDVTFPEALDAIAEMISSGRGGAVFTPNIDHVVLAEDDASFRGAYERAELAVVDGTLLLWSSRLLGVPLPEKISGSDLALPLMERAEREGWRVFLFGGAAGVADRAAAKLKERFPRIVIVGTDSTHVDMNAPASARADTIARIRDAKPDLVLVALGAPKQELFIDEAAGPLRPAVLIGVGATVDFIAGTMKRAPAWISGAGLEWLYRLAQEPGRLWKRYLVRDPRFLLILIRDLRKERSRRVVSGERWRSAPRAP